MSIPGSVNPLFLGAAGQATGGGEYQIERSVRFNAPDSAYLSRTPGTAGNRTTFTWAGWVKKGGLTGVTGHLWLMGGGTSGSNSDDIYFNAGNSTVDDRFVFASYYGGSQFQLELTRKFRDPSAWYHIVIAVNTTIASPSSDRVKIYVNGEVQTDFATANYPSQNFQFSYFNNTSEHLIGSSRFGSPGNYFSGYLADIHFIDGQALDPTSFGEFDTNGVWQPITDASGLTYGTNGFHLLFSDNSTAAALGTDTSSNGNTWTVNNISVTAGAGNDSLVDSPSSPADQTDTGVGGEVVGNYCTWNPLIYRYAYANKAELTNGNLDALFDATVHGQFAYGTISVSTGKWYFEYLINNTGGGGAGVGVANYDHANNLYSLERNYQYSGNKSNGTSTSYGASYTSGSVIGVALDMDTGSLTFYKNGVSQGVAFTDLLTLGSVSIFGSGDNSSNFTINAGQRPFAHNAPSGFKALCTTNLPEPTIADGSTVMDVALYTGDGNSTRTISGLGFAPDLVWIKSRTTTAWHTITDIVRGTNKTLSSNDTSAEFSTNNQGWLSQFNSDGFTVVAGAGGAGDVNGSSIPYVAWCWNAGGTTDPSNQAGSITSQVRANASAGFSIVTWTTTSAIGTVGHGLNITPSIVLFKRRDSAQDWYFETNIIDGSYDYLVLNSTAAKVDGGSSWSTRATSTTITSFTGAAGLTYVAYCFAPVAGYSAFGSYTGNGSTSGDGPFVHLGFRPRFLMVKCSNNGTNTDWVIIDSARDTYNISGLGLRANLSSAEYDDRVIGAGYTSFDLLSNGFKVKGASGRVNASNDTYIYCAFAESPFQYSRAR
jgi:hypothetical protein